MPSEIQERLADVEHLVRENPEEVNKRAGVPFVVFTYDPDDGLEVDAEIRNLIEKLEYNQQEVAAIDMRALVFSVLEERDILENVMELERRDEDRLLEGLKSSLLDGDGMGELAARIAEHAAAAETVVIYRMGILFPFASASTLMGQLEGNTPAETPIVFCYPASIDDNTLRFLDESVGTYYRAKVI